MLSGKLITNTVKCQTEEELFFFLSTGNRIVFSGHNTISLSLSECDEPSDSDSHKALLKAAGSEVLSYCFCSTDAFFLIPCVPLLDNALIINGFGNVYCQELLVMDSKQTSLSYLVTSEEGHAFL